MNAFDHSMNFPQFFLDYVAIVVGVFIKSCRTLPELEYLCQRHYTAFRDPVVRRAVDQDNVRALYRYVIISVSHVGLFSIFIIAGGLHCSQ